MEVKVLKLKEGNIAIDNLLHKQLLKSVKIAALNQRSLGRIILNY